VRSFVLNGLLNISVLGAGAWGTALAAALAPRHPVVLWARDAEQAAQMTSTRCNARYLPNASLPRELSITADYARALAHAHRGVVIAAAPMSALRALMQSIPSAQPLWWLSKGLEQGSHALGHEIAAQIGRMGPCGVLSGPSFAAEVVQGQPTALVAASANTAFREQAVAAFHGGALRVYSSADVVGVEIGGAVKNVMAIATGMADGLAAQGGPGAPGLNARAALITRGLAEMTRLGVALGAQPASFMGLSGLGDLVLTATGDLSRNRRVGLLLAQGLPLPQVLAQLGHVAEGVQCAQSVLERARAVGVEMPITECVVQVLLAEISPQQALLRLMSRDARAEGI
jgi:glycerol-3-phosphate dehydrogenase (NAD(P)+)